MKVICKKVVAVLLVLSMFLLIGNNSVKAEQSQIPQPASDVVTITKSREEIELEKRLAINKQVAKVIAQANRLNKSNKSTANTTSVVNAPHGGFYWKTEYGEAVTTYASGYAGNQVSNGYSFPTGGGFYYSDSGGPDVSFSVTVGGQFVSGSVNIGVKSDTLGLWVSAPTDNNFYKLYVVKTVEVTPYTVYLKENGVWTVYYRGTTHNTVSSTQFSVRVG